jgi:hypothetical protein
VNGSNGSAYWEVGPLAGQLFSVGQNAVPGAYANWGGAEPNDSGAPSAVYMNVGAEGWGVLNGQWADAKDGLANGDGVSTGDNMVGYFVEFTLVENPPFFVMPISGDLYIQQMGGEAGADSIFGLGTSPADFVPIYSGLPNSPNPISEVFAGAFSSGTEIDFGLQTLSIWAFSNGTDATSIEAFSDIDNHLGMSGSVFNKRANIVGCST